MSYSVSINQLNQQFEILVEEHKAFMVFRIHEQKIYLMHTEVPEVLKGKGIASCLVQFAFEHAKKNKLEVVVYCPFVKSYLERKKKN